MVKSMFLMLGVAAVGAMTLAIDGRSRVPAIHAEHQPAAETIFAIGRVEGAAPEIELRPELSGRIIHVHVCEGQRVNAGDALLQLDDAQYRQQVALAEAELALAEAQLERLLSGAHQQQRLEASALLQAKQAELERARRDWNRTRPLIQNKVVSQQDADNQWSQVASLTQQVEAAKARLELLKAPPRPHEVRMEQARVDAARAHLELAKLQLAHTTLRAPCGGQILLAQIEPGEMAAPTSTQPAIVLADTSRFRVRAFVEELDASRVQVGMTTQITFDGLPGQQTKGRISRLSPRMDRKDLWSDHPNERHDTKMREIWVELESGEGLVVGLRVDVLVDAGAGPQSRVQAEAYAEVKAGHRP